MKQKEINNEGYSQEEIDAIIDEIIEKEPVKEIKEHLIKYEKECREKRKTTKSMLKEEKCEYEINHPHDKAVRLMLANSQEAANLINLALKKEDLIKSSQIEQYKSSFVTKQYKNRESDIVYKDLKNKGIYYLIEHQSKQDKMMAVRITEYSLEIIRSALDLMKKEKREEFPTVIPIVLYTGKGKWKIPQSLEDVQVKLADINLPSIGSYKLIDINTYSDDDLIKAKGALPKVLLMEKNSNQLEKGIKQIEKCNFTKEEREIISVYITNIIGEINPKLAKEMLENINKNEEGKGMRLGQALVDYYYDGVTKGEKKRSKENSNKSNKKNAKRKL